MERGGKEKTAIPEEEKADAPSILPMTPESKQLAAVIATADNSRDRHGWKISPARQQQLDGEVLSRRFFGFAHTKHYQHRPQFEASSCDVARSQSRSLSRFPIKTVGTGMQVELPAANRIPVGGPPPRGRQSTQRSTS